MCDWNADSDELVFNITVDLSSAALGSAGLTAMHPQVIQQMLLRPRSSKLNT